MQKHMILATLDEVCRRMHSVADRLKEKEPALANEVEDGAIHLDLMRPHLVSELPDEEETVMLSPKLIAALEAQGVRQGQGVPPTGEQVLSALASVLGVPVAAERQKHLVCQECGGDAPDGTGICDPCFEADMDNDTE